MSDVCQGIEVRTTATPSSSFVNFSAELFCISLCSVRRSSYRMAVDVFVTSASSFISWKQRRWWTAVTFVCNLRFTFIVAWALCRGFKCRSIHALQSLYHSVCEKLNDIFSQEQIFGIFSGNLIIKNLIHYKNMDIIKHNLMFFWLCIMNWLYNNYQLDALTIIYS